MILSFFLLLLKLSIPVKRPGNVSFRDDISYKSCSLIKTVRRKIKGRVWKIMKKPQAIQWMDLRSSLTPPPPKKIQGFHPYFGGNCDPAPTPTNEESRISSCISCVRQRSVSCFMSLTFSLWRKINGTYDSCRRIYWYTFRHISPAFYHRQLLQIKERNQMKFTLPIYYLYV